MENEMAYNSDIDLYSVDGIILHIGRDDTQVESATTDTTSEIHIANGALFWLPSSYFRYCLILVRLGYAFLMWPVVSLHWPVETMIE